MRHRHRIWKQLVASLLAVTFVASCMAPPPRPFGMQRSPSMSRNLTPTAVISPFGDLNSNAGDAANDPNVKVVRVGLLLPLSGHNAELGKALQDAATVSLFDKYARLSPRQQNVRVELLPKDTGDTPEQAQQAMAAAMKDGAEFIIGPLFADATAGAAPIARAKNINVLSLSNTRTQASPGTFMFGFSPAEQTERVLNYALANSKQRIAVLAPKSPLGDTVLVTARNLFEKQGLKLAAEASYSPQGGGLDKALNSLATAGNKPGFDAILIPEGGPMLDTILQGLSARGVDPAHVKFLGTGLWDDAELLRRVGLDTAWFASSPPDLTAQFETRFRDTYHYAPPRIASLTYDAVALAVTLATSGRAFDVPTLTGAAGFAGPANGIFRLRANGLVQRGLAVLEVHGATKKVISVAPSGF